MNGQDGRDGGAPRHIAFLLCPKFAMIAFMSAVEPLRVANRLAGRELYRWSMAAPGATTVTASNGMTLMVEALAETAETPDVLLICAGFEPEASWGPALAAHLRRLDRAGTVLGAMDTGSFLLARAGLLDGHTVTVHWECLDSLAERFPAVRVQPFLFEIGRRRMTCAGGTAALDMMLHMIRLEHGHGLAAGASEQFIHTVIRDGSADQRMVVGSRLGTGHPRLEAAVLAMEQNLETPLDAAALADRVGLSLRQLQRAFRDRFDVTPHAYYLNLRLQRARSLVRYTAMSLGEVAVACGFNSYEHFSRSYRARFARSPQADRGTAQPVASGPVVRPVL